MRNPFYSIYRDFRACFERDPAARTPFGALEVIRAALPILRAMVGDRVEELIERSISTTAVTALGGELGLSRGQTKAAGQAAIWEALAPATKRTTTQSLRVKKAKVAK